MGPGIWLYRSSRVRVTASVLERPLSEAELKLMSAGRKDSASLLVWREEREDTEAGVEAGVSIRV